MPVALSRLIIGSVAILDAWVPLAFEERVLQYEYRDLGRLPGRCAQATVC